MAMSKPGDGGARSMTVEELSEELGWSWYQWRLFLFVGLCVAADSIEVNLLSFISVEATKDWHLEEFWEDTVAAAVFGGEVVGCALFGLFADKYGRLPAFAMGVAFVSAFGVASSFAGNVEHVRGELSIKHLSKAGTSSASTSRGATLPRVRSRRRARLLTNRVCSSTNIFNKNEPDGRPDCEKGSELNYDMLLLSGFLCAVPPGRSGASAPRSSSWTTS